METITIEKLLLLSTSKVTSFDINKHKSMHPKQNKL